MAGGEGEDMQAGVGAGSTCICAREDLRVYTCSYPRREDSAHAQHEREPSQVLLPCFLAEET